MVILIFPNGSVLIPVPYFSTIRYCQALLPLAFFLLELT
jgi:hypothetical protein